MPEFEMRKFGLLTPPMEVPLVCLVRGWLGRLYRAIDMQTGRGGILSGFEALYHAQCTAIIIVTTTTMIMIMIINNTSNNRNNTSNNEIILVIMKIII